MSSEAPINQIIAQAQRQAVSSQKQLNVVRAQIASKEREKTMQSLTLNQLEGNEESTRLYRGVGKMFVAEKRDVLLEELRKKQTSSNDDALSLSKKQKFLVKQVEDSTSHLKDIFNSLERAAAAQA